MELLGGARDAQVGKDDVQRPVAVLGEGLDGVSQGALLLDLIPHEQALDLDALQVVAQAARRPVAVLESLVDVCLQVMMVFLDVNGLVHKNSWLANKCKIQPVDNQY